MRHGLLAALCLILSPAFASTPAGPRALVHAYPPTGPAEVAGVALASKVLRTMQQHAVPAFTDVLALHVAYTLQGESSQVVAVTRKTRQSGAEAAAAVASAAADGRTLLLAGTDAEPTGRSPTLQLRPVALVASMPFVLVAHSESSSGEILDLIRGTRGRLLVGSAGEKTVSHAAIERLRARRGSTIEAVPYNGGIAALHAVATRQVSAALVPLPAVLPYLAAGHVRLLAIAEPRRHPRIPQVPTSAEVGLPELDAVSAFGVFAPVATPLPVVRELEAALARGERSAETREVFLDFGLRLEYRGAGALTPRKVYRPHEKTQGALKAHPALSSSAG
ncbi:MAG TPA: tripartite tricarboxylate transporter substrate-binding protein [Burkholderiales bacterium]|nr:tripartite tricarboxylate transporter substrate-binding protein [Burkholderiales bacterium]